MAAACDTIRARMAAHLADRFGCAAADVTFADGQVQAGDETLTFAEAAQSAYEARVSLSATGFYKTPNLKWDRARGSGRPFFYFA